MILIYLLFFEGTSFPSSRYFMFIVFFHFIHISLSHIFCPHFLSFPSLPPKVEGKGCHQNELLLENKYWFYLSLRGIHVSFMKFAIMLQIPFTIEVVKFYHQSSLQSMHNLHHEKALIAGSKRSQIFHHPKIASHKWW